MPLIAVVRARTYDQGAELTKPSVAEVVPDNVIVAISINPTPSFDTSIRTVALTAPVPLTVAWKVRSAENAVVESPVADPDVVVSIWYAGIDYSWQLEIWEPAEAGGSHYGLLTGTNEGLNRMAATDTQPTDVTPVWTSRA